MRWPFPSLRLTRDARTSKAPGIQSNPIGVDHQVIAGGSAGVNVIKIQSNRVFVTVECSYGFKVAVVAGIKRIVKP